MSWPSRHSRLCFPHFPTVFSPGCWSDTVVHHPRHIPHSTTNRLSIAPLTVIVKIVTCDSTISMIDSLPFPKIFQLAGGQTLSISISITTGLLSLVHPNQQRPQPCHQWLFPETAIAGLFGASLPINRVCVQFSSCSLVCPCLCLCP